MPGRPEEGRLQLTLACMKEFQRYWQRYGAPVVGTRVSSLLVLRAGSHASHHLSDNLMLFGLWC